jgi:hypothetical protein
MVGQLPLEQHIGVRIPGGNQTQSPLTQSLLRAQLSLHDVVAEFLFSRASLDPESRVAAVPLINSACGTCHTFPLTSVTLNGVCLELPRDSGGKARLLSGG